MTVMKWWREMPAWLKAVVLFTAIPAWLVLLASIVMGQNMGTVGLAAFVVFAVTCVLHAIWFYSGGAAGILPGTDYSED